MIITINNKEIHCIELSWHFFIFNPLQKTIGPFISWAYNILNLIVMAAPVCRIRIEIGINKLTNITAEKYEEKTTRIWVFFATYYFYKFALTNCKLIKRIGGKEQYWMMHRICSFMKMRFEEIWVSHSCVQFKKIRSTQFEELHSQFSFFFRRTLLTIDSCRN